MCMPVLNENCTVSGFAIRGRLSRFYHKSYFGLVPKLHKQGPTGPPLNRNQVRQLLGKLQKHVQTKKTNLCRGKLNKTCFG